MLDPSAEAKRRARHLVDGELVGETRTAPLQIGQADHHCDCPLIPTTIVSG